MILKVFIIQLNEKIEEEWRGVSANCKSLIRKMIMKDPKKRCTAEQALQDVWIKSLASGTKEGLNTKIVNNIFAFKSLQRLKKAVLLYIATQLSLTEVKKMREIFTGMDKDGDGKLSLEEFQESCKKFTGAINAKDILASIDTDKSGYIDYTGKNTIYL